MGRWCKKVHMMWFVFLLFTLSGCFFQPVENLYHLPQQSMEYEQLMYEIGLVRTALEQNNPGVEYANILSGDNTATIQLQNLGSSNEVDTAMTFFRVPGAENPIRIYVFSLDLDGNYVVSCVIEGQGSSILSIDFAQLNGIGKKEIVVNWQNNVLGVYSLDYTPPVEEQGTQTTVSQFPEATPLLTTSHSHFALWDMDRDGICDLTVVRLDIAGGNSFAELYQWTEGALVTHSIAPLSAGITSISNVRANYVTGSVPALYVVSNLVDGGRATDLILINSNRLANVTLEEETGVSVEVLREYNDLGLTDINQDGVLELPNPVLLPSFVEEGAVANGSFWTTDWVQYNSRGTSSEVFTTFHNVADSWYFIIPNHWQGQISVSRDDSVQGQRTVIFSRWNEAGSPPSPFLAIYQLTGPNRYTRAALPDRFELGGDSVTLYAASLMDDTWDCGLEQQDIIQSFHQIISPWS